MYHIRYSVNICNVVDVVLDEQPIDHSRFRYWYSIDGILQHAEKIFDCVHCPFWIHMSFGTYPAHIYYLYRSKHKDAKTNSKIVFLFKFECDA